MNLMAHGGVQSVDAIRPHEVLKLKEVHGSLPVTARSRTVLNLNAKIWEAWAETHPEEGPFK